MRRYSLVLACVLCYYAVRAYRDRIYSRAFFWTPFGLRGVIGRSAKTKPERLQTHGRRSRHLPCLLAWLHLFKLRINAVTFCISRQVFIMGRYWLMLTCVVCYDVVRWCVVPVESGIFQSIPLDAVSTLGRYSVGLSQSLRP